MSSEQPKSLEEQKKYICNGVKKLSKEDLIDIGKLIHRMGYGNNLKYCADGARINLDKLGDGTPGAINRLYTQVKHKIAKNNSDT